MAAAAVQPGSDVSKPGTTPADPTSRPIIVGHTPPVADPMVSSVQGAIPAKKEGEEPAKMTSAGSMKPKLTPTSSGEEVIKEANKENDEKVAEESAEKKQETAAEVATKLNELIESGEYNVTVHQKNKGSAAQFILVVLAIVVLASVILFLLIDLNIIDVGVKLPFEIFK